MFDTERNDEAERILMEKRYYTSVEDLVFCLGGIRFPIVGPRGFGVWRVVGVGRTARRSHENPEMKTPPNLFRRGGGTTQCNDEGARKSTEGQKLMTMGTTESLFLETTPSHEEDGDGSTSGQTHESYPQWNAVEVGTGGASGVPSIPLSHVVREEGPPRSGPVVNGGSKRPGKPQRRGIDRGLRPLQLDGALVGLRGSGKRTLLQRLDGQDPFLEPANGSHGHTTTNQHNNVKSFSVAQAKGEVLVNQVIVPYQPPGKVWDRVRLRVLSSEHLIRSKDIDPEGAETATSLDFLVILLHPRTKRERLKSFLTKTLQRYLDRQGYSNASRRTSSDHERSTTLPPRPISLCLLLNFRDLVNPSDASQSSIQESDITSTTMEILQQQSTLDPSKLVLQFGVTSLKNCYGLDVLHNFIYQSYLLRKQWDLQQQLSEIEQVHSHSKRVQSTESYNQFLTRIFGKHDQPTVDRKSHDSDKNEAYMDSAQNDTRRQSQTNGSSTTIAPVSHAPQQQSTQRPGHFSTPSASSTIPVISVALEDFLASSDDEEDKKNTPPHNRDQGKGPIHPESDSDDDEEFFVSGDGNNTVIKDEKKKDSSSPRGHSSDAESVQRVGGAKESVSKTTKVDDDHSSVAETSTINKSPLIIDEEKGSTSTSSQQISKGEQVFNNGGDGKESGDVSLNRPEKESTNDEKVQLEVSRVETLTATDSIAAAASESTVVAVESDEGDNHSELRPTDVNQEPDEAGQSVVKHESTPDESSTKGESTLTKAVAVTPEPVTDQSGNSSFLEKEKLPITKRDTNPLDDEDSDDEEFFIGGLNQETAASTNQASQSVTYSAAPPPDNKRNEPEKTTTTNNLGLSSAALAAIANAQREAEMMLSTSEPTKAKKKTEKKKKKSKEMKKTRKKSSSANEGTVTAETD